MASSFLNQAERLQLTNSVLSALPTFILSTFKLQNTVIEQIDKYRRHCLWRGSDMQSKKLPSVAWPMVCTSKDQGGLGVLNLGDHNKAMLMKYLHKFYNRDDIPWVGLVWESYYSNGRLPGNISKGSFWWKDVTKLIHKFKSIAKVDLKDGMTCMFWSDKWLGMIPKTSFPELYSFAKIKTITFSSVMNEDSLQNLFHLPLSEEAFSQFTQLQNLMVSFHFIDAKDTWGYNWGSNFFSSSKVYKQLRSDSPVNTKFRWLWNSSCQNKHRVFFWLILQDRLNTRGVLRRRNMNLRIIIASFALSSMKSLLSTRSFPVLLQQKLGTPSA